jgi:hypothetical protein
LVKVTILDCIKASLIFFKDSSMTDKLTTAEVRLAATTNLDLPLTQYKKLESGFDAWLESVKAEAAAAALATVKTSGKPVKEKKPQPPRPIDPETGRPRLSRRERARIERREANKAKDLV